MSGPGAIEAALLGAMLAALVLVAPQGCSREEAERISPEPVRLALPLQTPSALAMLAAEEGLFERVGLSVEVTEHVSGKRALAAMLAGEADLATVAEVPIVFSSFERDDFRILAGVGSVTGEHRVVAHRSRGIEQPADLRGKRIATQRASAVHFYLHLFLIKHGISEEDVELVFHDVEELPEALAAGRIDAFCMREPFVSRARELLGPDAVVLGEPGLYFHTDYLVARTDFLRERPEAARAVLRALGRAEEAAGRRPGRTRARIARRLGAEALRAADPPARLRLKVSLDQSLYSSLEAVARWAMETRLVDADEMPDFLELVQADCLDAVQPQAVTIIR